MTIASGIFDWLADFFRDRRHELTRREMLDALHALGVMHANLLRAKPEIKDFVEVWSEHERLDCHVTFGPHRGEPTAYERRRRDNIAPEVMEARARVAAILAGPENVDSWHAMLDRTGRFKGMLNGARHDQVRRFNVGHGPASEEGRDERR